MLDAAEMPPVHGHASSPRLSCAGRGVAARHGRCWRYGTAPRRRPLHRSRYRACSRRSRLAAVCGRCALAAEGRSPRRVAGSAAVTCARGRCDGRGPLRCSSASWRGATSLARAGMAREGRDVCRRATGQPRATRRMPAR